MAVQSIVTADDLMAGVAATYEVTISPEVLEPGPRQGASERKSLVVQLRPLSIGTFQLIMKAARQDAGLIPILMIKESLIEPSLSAEQVKQLHLGMVSFLIDHIREISGLAEKKSIEELRAAPLGQPVLPDGTSLWLDTAANASTDHGSGSHFGRDARE